MALNIFFTVEPQYMIKSIFANAKCFSILDVQELIKDYDVNIHKPSDLYYINNIIINKIKHFSSLKRSLGIIYINNEIKPKMLDSLKQVFKDEKEQPKFILIDNGIVPKLSDIHNQFEEVLFYERFKKIKI